MPHFFIILLKINLVLALFAAAYYLVLRRLTFYVINRIFLLFGILFSTIYPFINLTNFFNQHKALPAFVPGLNQNVQELVQLDAVSFFWRVLTVIFYLGVIFMASRLVIQFISLYRVHKNSNPGLVDNNKVRVLTDEVSPFSFWQTIYVNPTLHKSQDLKNIIEHEKVHVEEWHTIDIILAEISLVFYWFNPGVWLMKKAVRENIEFVTDAKILKRGIDKKAYQYSLLDVGTLQPSVAIVNNFNFSDLKKRIKMMNAKRSSKFNLTRYLFVLPVLLCFTLAFTIDKKDVRKNLVPLEKFVLNIMPDKKIENKIEKVQVSKKKKLVKQVLKQPKAIDTAKNLIRISLQEVKESDTLDKILNLFLKRKNEEIPVSFYAENKTEGKVFLSSFTFSDAANNAEEPKINKITITMNNDKDSRYSVAVDKKNIVNLVKFKTANSSGDSLSVPNKTKRFFVTKFTTYFVNDNKISKDDLSKLSAEQITNMVVSKDGIINIKTKQK